MPENPYPGLRPFQRDEAHLFFGRDEQTDHLLDKLAQTRFITVTGLSGSGKSSLVQAGLLPNLEFGYLTDAGANWGILTMRPSITPIQNLAQAVIDAGLFDATLSPDLTGFQNLSGLTTPAQILAQRLSSGGHLEFARILQEGLSPGQRRSFLLVVDQFEELFRYEKLSRLEERKFFVELLLTTAKQQDVPVYVVITIRSDSLGQCALFRGLPEVINAGQFLVPRLIQEQMRLAITAPMQVVGGNIDDRLVLRLLQDIELNSDQLPVLQHCLMRMWAQAQKQTNTPAVSLTVQDYESLGGLPEALSQHADEAYAELLDERQQQIAERMFRCLTEGDLRRPVRVKDVAAVAGTSAAEVAAVAMVFRQADRCFLSPYGNTRLETETVMDISHESLIRQWCRLREWTREEAESATVYRRLEQTARLWKQGKAALWDTPDLEIALAWQNREHPTRTWAERYSYQPTDQQGFDLAREFLEVSYQVQEKQRSRDRFRKYMNIIRYFVILVMFCLMWVNFFDIIGLDAITESYTIWIGDLFPKEPRFSKDIAIVYISEETIRQHDADKKEESWRNEWAKLIDVLSQAGAKVIVFDLYFHESKEFDQEFINTIKIAQEKYKTAVIVGGYESDGNTLKIMEDLNRVVAGVGAICIGNRKGIATVPLVILKYPLTVVQQGNLDISTPSFEIFETLENLPYIPSLAFKAFEVYNNGIYADRTTVTKIDQQIFMWNSGKKKIENFRFSRIDRYDQNQQDCPIIHKNDETIELIIDLTPLNILRKQEWDYKNVIKANGQLEQFKNKIVLIGKKDEKNFRVRWGEKRYGWELHADALNTILNKVIIHSVGTWWQLVIMILLGLIGASIRSWVSQSHQYWRRALLAGTMVAYLLSAILLYMEYHLLLNIVYHIVTLWIIYCVGGKIEQRHKSVMQI